MGIDILKLKPHVIDKNLNSHLMYIYGAGGVGKTTFGVQAEKALLLAAERGYDALGGENVIPADIHNWSEMKAVERQLTKSQEAKDTFKTVVVDTVDIMSKLCEKYVCDQLDIENIGDGGWSKNGWDKVKNEWKNTFNNIAMAGYGVIFISHAKEKTFKRKDGTEYTQIVPSCSTAYNTIIREMVSIQGYIKVEDGERKLVLRSNDDTVECKSRFKYIDPVIPFSYQSLSDAVTRAINEEEKEIGSKFVTEEAVSETVKELNFDELKKEFDSIVDGLMKSVSEEEFEERYSPKIKKIIQTELGVGKKVSQCKPSQVEQLAVIVDNLKNL